MTTRTRAMMAMVRVFIDSPDVVVSWRCWARRLVTDPNPFTNNAPARGCVGASPPNGGSAMNMSREKEFVMRARRLVSFRAPETTQLRPGGAG